MPAITQTKIANVRQPCGVIVSGRGTSSVIARKSTTSAARRPRRTEGGGGGHVRAPVVAGTTPGADQAEARAGHPRQLRAIARGALGVTQGVERRVEDRGHDRIGRRRAGSASTRLRGGPRPGPTCAGRRDGATPSAATRPGRRGCDTRTARRRARRGWSARIARMRSRVASARAWYRPVRAARVADAGRRSGRQQVDIFALTNITRANIFALANILCSALACIAGEGDEDEHPDDIKTR